MPTAGDAQSIAPRLDFLDMAGLLQLKVAGDPFPHSFIHEVSAYSAAPEDLVRGRDPAPGTDGKETAWYFCSPVKSAERRNREVGGGGGHMFWHPEGGARPIQGADGKSVGAYRRTLSYVRKVKNPTGGTASKTHRNIRQGWCMIEVGLLKQHAPAGAGHQWEICKVYRSPSPPSRADLAETSTAAAGAEVVVPAAGTGMSGAEVRQHDSTPEAGVIPEVTGGGTPCPPAPLPSSCAFKQETLAIVNKSSAAATVVVKIDGSSAQEMKEMANLVLSSPAVAGIVLSANKLSNLAILRAAIKAREASDIHMLAFANSIRLLHHCTIDELGLDKSIISGYLDELELHLQNVHLTKELTPHLRDYLVSFEERMCTIMFYEYLNKLAKGTMQEWELRTVTTFGKDGSDLTAAIIGRELGSKEIQVWNHHNIYTCDLNANVKAITIPWLTFDEAAELGLFIGKSMQVVKEVGIKVIVKDLYNPQADGTVITKTRDMSKCTLTGIVLKSNITMLDIEATSICMLDQKTFVEKAISVFDILKYWSIDIEWVANSQGKISLALVRSNFLFMFYHKVFQLAIDNAVQELTKFASVDRLNNKSVILLIGNPQLLTSILEKACSVLQSNHIAFQKAPQGLSKVKVSLVVDDSEGERCVELLHHAFFETTDDYFPAIANSSGVASLLLESWEAHLSSQFYTGGEGVELLNIV